MEPERKLLKPSKEKYVETAYSPSCKKRFFLELKYLHKLSPSRFSGGSDASNGWFWLLSVGSGELFQHLTPWWILRSTEALSLSLSSKFPLWDQEEPSEPHSPWGARCVSQIYTGANPSRKGLHEGLYISLRSRLPWSSEQGEYGRGATAPGFSPCLWIHPVPVDSLTQQTSTVISRPFPAQEKLR